MKQDGSDLEPFDEVYLCDRDGEPPDDVRRWEALFAELREATPIPPAEVLLRRIRARRRTRLLLAAAASLVLAAGAAALWRASRPTWELVVVAGAPRVEGHEGQQPQAIGPGSVVTTDASSRARIRVGAIGWVEVASLSTVRIVRSDEGLFRMAVDRGSMRADITAPPGRFVVDTPDATAIDLGCLYTLSVSDRGDALLTVDGGWVLLESDTYEALVPQGAQAATRRGHGAGSPYYLDASPLFLEALHQVDFGAHAGRDEALGQVLQQARSRDALTLLTLLRRVDASQRARVHDRLAVLLPPPAGVTRSGIVAGDGAMIDRWWTALRLEIPKKTPLRVPRTGGTNIP